MKTKTNLILPYCISLLLISLGACTHVSKTAKTSDTLATVKLISEKNMEYIDWDSLKINGLVHMISRKPALVYKNLGKPDSVVSPDMSNVCGTFFEDTFKYIYIKGAQFELRGDSLVFSALEFNNSDLKLIKGSLTLDRNTKVADLNKFFPTAVKDQYVITIEHNEKRTVIMLGLDKKHKKDDTDDTWMLLFKDGKLVEIEHHIDC